MQTPQSPAATASLSGEPHARADRMPPLKGEVSAKRTVGFAAANKLRWGSGGAVGGADSRLLPRILPSGYALFESLPQPGGILLLGFPLLLMRDERANFGGGLGERSAGPTAACCRASCRQAVHYSRASPSRAGHCCWDSRPFSCGKSAQTSVGVWGSAKRSGASPRPPGSAALPHNPQGILRIRRNQLLQSMAVDFVARTGGSRWLSALPTGGSRWVQAQPAGASPNPPESAMPTNVFRELPENRRIRELQFMVPEFVARPGGSNRNRALPG